MKTYRIAAQRGRCNGDWHTSEHYQVLEIGGEISNSLTHVAKDNYLYEEYQDTEQHEEGIPGML